MASHIDQKDTMEFRKSVSIINLITKGINHKLFTVKSRLRFLFAQFVVWCQKVAVAASGWNVNRRQAVFCIVMNKIYNLVATVRMRISRFINNLLKHIFGDRKTFIFPVHFFRFATTHFTKLLFFIVSCICIFGSSSREQGVQGWSFL